MLAAIAAWNSVSSTRRYPESQRRNLNISTLFIMRGAVFRHWLGGIVALSGWPLNGPIGLSLHPQRPKPFSPPAEAARCHAQGGCQLLPYVCWISIEPLGIRRCLGAFLLCSPTLRYPFPRWPPDRCQPNGGVRLRADQTFDMTCLRYLGSAFYLERGHDWVDCPWQALTDNRRTNEQATGFGGSCRIAWGLYA